MELIKTIFFILTVLVLLYSILVSKFKYKDERLYIISALIITFILIFIISIKLHHLLRDELNISNTITYTLSSIPFIYHILKFRSIIVRTVPVLFFLSLIFIGLAVILDLLTDGKLMDFHYSDLIEEILRILGAMFWLFYFIFYIIKIRKS